MAQLAVFILLCSIIGFALATNHYNAWVLLCYTLAGVIALQLSYLLASVYATD